MPEPDEVQFACIGCGAMNPAGASACSGCGHIFAGLGAAPHLVLVPASAHASTDLPGSYRRLKPVGEGSALGCLAKAIGITLTVIAMSIAFVVAFFATCVSIQGQTGDFLLFWSLIAGLIAAGLVVGLVLGIVRLCSHQS